MEISIIKVFLVIWALTPTEIPIFERHEMPNLSACWAAAAQQVLTTTQEASDEPDLRFGAACYLEKVPGRPA